MLPLLYFIDEFVSYPPSVGTCKRACHTCHGVTRVAHVVELLVSRTLGLVDRRVLSAKTASRARSPDPWPTSCGHEEGFLDGARDMQPMLGLLAERHTVGACFDVSLWGSRVTSHHCNAL